MSAAAELLRQAAMAGDVATTRGLLDDGVDPNTKIAGYPVLTLVCDSRHRLASQMESGEWPAVAALLIDRGADLHARNPLGHQPIHLAARGDKADTLTVLVGAGADLAAQDGTGKMPIDLALQNGTLEIVQALVDAGSPLPDLSEGKHHGYLMQFPDKAAQILACERIVRAALLTRGLSSAMEDGAPAQAPHHSRGVSPL